MWAREWARGGGRVAWWAWDSRNGSRCVWVCVLCSLVFAASEAAALYVVPPFVSDRVLSREREATGRRKVRRSTGVKWRLKFQWQSGRNPPELSPHMSRNPADISRLLQPRRGFTDWHFLLVCVALKSIASLFLISCIQTNQAYFMFHTFESSQQMWLCKHLLLTWRFYSPSVLPPNFSTARFQTMYTIFNLQWSKLASTWCNMFLDCIVIHVGILCCRNSLINV